jgi:Icc-related predicted phosphoesterase
MVVTDLHGDWDAYQRYRDCFVDLQAKGQANCLIFTGDLIHRDAPTHPDCSLEIVLDVISLQETFGEAIICLCGNHELPHLYGFGPLSDSLYK